MKINTTQNFKTLKGLSNPTFIINLNNNNGNLYNIKILSLKCYMLHQLPQNYIKHFYNDWIQRKLQLSDMSPVYPITENQETHSMDIRSRVGELHGKIYGVVCRFMSNHLITVDI